MSVITETPKSAFVIPSPYKGGVLSAASRLFCVCPTQERRIAKMKIWRKQFPLARVTCHSGFEVMGQKSRSLDLTKFRHEMAIFYEQMFIQSLKSVEILSLAHPEGSRKS